jgi:hypothetical protein
MAALQNHVETLRAYIETLSVVDSHEHLLKDEERMQAGMDFFWLFSQYADTCLYSAGMPIPEHDAYMQNKLSFDENFAIFYPYYLKSKNCAYIKVGEIAARDIYGVDKIDYDGAKEIDRRMKEANKPGISRKILQEKGNIVYCMTDRQRFHITDKRFLAHLEGDIELFRPVIKMDFFLQCDPCFRRLLTEETGMECGDYVTYKNAIRAFIAKNADVLGAIKCAMSYNRKLDFECGIDESYLSGLFSKTITGQKLDRKEQLALESGLFWHFIDMASDFHLPVKVHTGLRGGRTPGGMSDYSLNIRHLIDIAATRPEVSFIAMHIGYPFQNELLVAGKCYQNIYADLSWAWAFDQVTAGSFYKAAVTAMPQNKIFGFGGDYRAAESSYGHLQLAKAGLAQALAELVLENYFSMDEAKECAKWSLFDAANEVFGKKAK